jgi:hypothetical protein
MHELATLQRLALAQGVPDTEILATVVSHLIHHAVTPVTEVILARVPRALEGKVGGVVASRGRVRSGFGGKVTVRG